LSRLHALEGHHDEVKQELEKNIQTLRAQIARYDAEYVKNLEVLNGLSDHLLTLLKNVSLGHLFCSLSTLSTLSTKTSHHNRKRQVAVYLS
jgi:hypothetical protein